MFKAKYPVILIVGSLLFLLVAVAKFYFPEILYLNSGLVLLVFYTIFLEKNTITWVFGAMGLLLVVASAWIFHGMAQPDVLLAEGFSGLVLILSTLLVVKIKAVYRSAKSERQQLNALFEYATEGVVLTNKRGEIILVNPAALQLFGYDKKELIGKPVEILIPARVEHDHVRYRHGFYSKPSNRTMGHGRDLFAKHASGREFPVEVSLSHFKQQHEMFVIAFIVDITARKEAERNLIEQKNQLENVTNSIQRLNIALESKVEERTLILKEALSELERSRQELTEALEKEKELNEIKSRFVSMASHEFRTPLSSVMSSASLIGKYTREDQQDKREKHIHRIKESVKNLNEILEDFLSLGKLEEGKISIAHESFDVQEFLNDLVEELKTILKPGQDIVVNISGARHFSTDKKQLKNILINLMSNAIKFSSENTNILLDASVDEQQLSIRVKDSGIGIAPEDKIHLFSSFFRGKNATNIQGTGLGLHIVKRYLDLLEGEIDIDSELNSGTTISFSIPYRGA